ncbi:MAG: hypothetical protein V4474_04140 [Patescibacteria group bacterium]
MPEQLQNIEKKIDVLETKMDAMYVSQEKTRKYFLWTMIITIAVIVIPLFILPLVLPSFLDSLVLPPGV